MAGSTIQPKHLRRFHTLFNSLLMVEPGLESFYSCLALLGRPYEALSHQSLGDVLKDVLVLEAASQVVLDAVFPPNIQQGPGLPVRPGHLATGLCHSSPGCSLGF